MKYNGILVTGRGTYPYRPSVSADFDWAYDLFKRINMDVVTAQAGEWPEPWQQDFFSGNFFDYPPRVIEDNGKPIGLFWLDEVDDVIDLGLHIDKSHQGRGIARAFGNMALAAAHGAKLPLQCDVLTSNKRAIQLYQLFGFIIISEVRKNGWVEDFSMGHKDTEQYRPASQGA